MNPVEIKTLSSTDSPLIGKIAGWYLQHWSIPAERTAERLGRMHEQDVLFQLLLQTGGNEIATGGLYRQVGLFQEHPRFREYGPWIALLYTIPEMRNQGAGKILLEAIENKAAEQGYPVLYLYTFTAESLYLREGWKVIERVQYRGHDTAVMKKEIIKP